MGRYGWLINTLDSLGFATSWSVNIWRALFPESSRGLRVTGEDASLDKLDRAAANGYYQSHYAAGQCNPVVVGTHLGAGARQRREAFR